MVNTGLPNPKIIGTGSFKSPEPNLLSQASAVGQLVIYSNYIGIIIEVTDEYVRIDTRYNDRCSNLFNTQPIEVKDTVLIGKKIIID